MIISEGNGMQADSIAISKTMPLYPMVDMTLIIQTANNPITFSIILYSLIEVYDEFYLMLRKPLMNQQNFTIMNYSIFKKYI